MHLLVVPRRYSVWPSGAEADSASRTIDVTRRACSDGSLHTLRAMRPDPQRPTRWAR